MALITIPARKTRKLTHNATHHEHKYTIVKRSL